MAEGEAGTGGAQPEGGSQDAGTSGLYDNLDAAPEALRPALEAELKKIEGNVTKKFQEAANYRKQWEPYSELGLTDVPPEYLQELLQFGQLAQNEDEFNQWLAQAAQERGLLGEQEGELGGEQEGEESPFNAEQLSEAITQALDDRLGPIEQGQREAQAASDVEQALDAIESEHGEFDREIVCQLAMTYATDGMGVEALSKAFEDYQTLMSQAENGVFDRKANQPHTPERGGRADTSPPAITSFKDATEAAMAAVRASAQ